MTDISTPARTAHFNAKIEGDLRFVPGARLVRKMKESNGTYTECWCFIAKNITDLVEIKRNILRETDIESTKTSSANGEQSFALEQYGDIVWMTIHGLNA